MSNSKDETTKKIAEWLENQGYPLEMEVANEFQNAGFTVSLSDWYKDFETDEKREIDVTALRWSNFNKPSVLQVCWRIECKLAREKPWIIFVSPSQPEQFIPFDVIASDEYKSIILEKYKDNDFRSRMLGLALFKRRFVGHGITQAFTTGQDVPYKAIMSSVKSSVDRVIQAAELVRLERVKENHQYLCIAFPVIVIDGRLFEYFVGKEGENQLKEIQSGVVNWKGANPSHSSPLVYIVTKQELGRFVQSAKEATNILIDLTT